MAVPLGEDQGKDMIPAARVCACNTAGRASRPLRGLQAIGSGVCHALCVQDVHPTSLRHLAVHMSCNLWPIGDGVPLLTEFGGASR